MQITSKFTIAVHIITAIDYFKDSEKVTSNFLAGSVGVKESGIIEISQGKSGIGLAKGLDEITFYDVYKAVDCVDGEGLFHFHENPNIKCPVGRNIHLAMDEKLQRVQDTMENELRHITIADVAADIKKEVDSAD